MTSLPAANGGNIPNLNPNHLTLSTVLSTVAVVIMGSQKWQNYPQIYVTKNNLKITALN